MPKRLLLGKHLFPLYTGARKLHVQIDICPLHRYVMGAACAVLDCALIHSSL